MLKRLFKHLMTSDSILREQKNGVRSLNHDEAAEITAANHVFAITGKAFDYFWAQTTRFKSESISFAGFDNPLKEVHELDLVMENCDS